MRSMGTKVAGSGGVQSSTAFDSEASDFLSVGTGGIAPEGTGPEPAFEIEVAVVAFVFRENEDCVERLVSLENTLSRRDPLVARDVFVLLFGSGGR